MNDTESNKTNVIINDRYINFKVFKKADDLDTQEKTLLKIHTYLNEGILPKCVGMGIAGGIVGMFIGAFFFSMQPSQIDHTSNYKIQLKEHFSSFKQSLKNSCKNFAKIGFLFSFYENSLQKIRAANDITNTLYSGCLTGASISYKRRPTAVLSGCLSFAAFSVIVEKLQRSSKF